MGEAALNLSIQCVFCAALTETPMKFIFTLLMICSLAMPALAADVQPTDEWKNSSEIGALQTSGNTRTLTLNAKTRMSHEGRHLRDTFEASAHAATDRNTTTAEKYTASLQEDWKITDRDYLLLRIGFITDRFSGFRRRTSETIGYGRDLIKSDAFEWNMELGGGLRQSKLTNNTSNNESIVRGSTRAQWQIADSATLIQKLSTEGGKSGWASKSVTALQQKINSHLASKISLTLEHNSKVPTGRKKLDIETAITLVVNY